LHLLYQDLAYLQRVAVLDSHYLFVLPVHYLVAAVALLDFLFVLLLAVALVAAAAVLLRSLRCFLDLDFSLFTKALPKL